MIDQPVDNDPPTPQPPRMTLPLGHFHKFLSLTPAPSLPEWEEALLACPQMNCSLNPDINIASEKIFGINSVI